MSERRRRGRRWARHDVQVGLGGGHAAPGRPPAGSRNGAVLNACGPFVTSVYVFAREWVRRELLTVWRTSFRLATGLAFGAQHTIHATFQRPQTVAEGYTSTFGVNCGLAANPASAARAGTRRALEVSCTCARGHQAAPQGRASCDRGQPWRQAGPQPEEAVATYSRNRPSMAVAWRPGVDDEARRAEPAPGAMTADPEDQAGHNRTDNEFHALVRALRQPRSEELVEAQRAGHARQILTRDVNVSDARAQHARIVEAIVAATQTPPRRL